MIGQRILEFADLQRLSGCEQRAAVERWCAAQGLRVKYGKAGPFTTVDALNAALGLAANESPGALDPGLVG